VDFDCWDWKAIQDHTPGPDEHGTLTITGTCGQFPAKGYALELKPTRGGINPWEPFFELVVTPPGGNVSKILTDEQVIHLMPARRDEKYEKVHISYEDQALATIDVQHLP
jgi:hypothetical protein